MSPRYLTPLFEGRDEYRAVIKVENRRILMYEAWIEPQRTLDEYILRAGLETGFKVPYTKSPNYKRGLRWCGRCQLAYPSERCPVCGNPLRARPKRNRDSRCSPRETSGRPPRI